MKENKRVLSYDILRAICALIIIAFHYSCTIEKEGFHPLYTYANGNWGSLCVSIFLMVSGASLCLGYKDIDNMEVWSFYKKRFLAIFPMFYLVWFFMYIINVWKRKEFFFAGLPIKILLSLIGMDGYFSYLGTNYYMNVGEWFLGALIWCYLFFPLLIRVTKNSYLYVGGGILGISLEILMLSTDFFKISPIRNLITCITSFFIGIGISIYYDRIKENTKSLLVILLLLDLIFFLKVPVPFPSLFVMQGMSVIIILCSIKVENYVAKKILLKKTIMFLSKLSYPIFLLQHIMINFLLAKIGNKGIYSLVIIYLCTIIGAWLLSKMMHKLSKVIIGARKYAN